MNESSDAPLRRVYLDNAATSWPKSSAAVEAAERFIHECGATSGRGAYRSAMLADRWLADARHHLARLLNAADAESIAVCSSGTHALNAALWGLLQPGDHVVTSAIEHNSLLRPLKQLETHHAVRVSIVPCDADGFVDPRAADELICEDTRWIAIGHASNVSGRIQALAPWRDLARRVNARLLVDASQTLGYIPIDVQASGIDALAAAGHKGLRGLAGTGLLMVARELQSQLRPLMFGGTGMASEQLQMGQSWPQSVEVGNLNMPGVVSLSVAAAECQRAQQSLIENSAAIAQPAWRAPLQRLVSGLKQFPAIRLIGWDGQAGGEWDRVDRIPVVSLQVAGWDVHDLASVLDSSFGIEVRAGWHCAALVHDALGTADSGGTLRLSPGPSTTPEEIDWTLAAFHEILG
ncbi:MAG: aminotransferase class V-fold PLP-dependent enzyme [Aureliella sp.]